jgi:hypothetical protein
MLNLTETDSVSSKTWLEGNQNILINVFVESFVPTLNIPGNSLVQAEFNAWDSLSDEALLNFEQEQI